MRVRQNNTFAEYLSRLMEKHGITSSRQVRIRTGVSHTTIEAILDGTQPSAETALKIASGFKSDQVETLRAAGFEDLADDMQSGIERAIEQGRSAIIREDGPDYNTDEPVDEEEGQVLMYYRKIPPMMQARARAVLKAFVDEDEDYEEGKVFGKKAE